MDRALMLWRFLVALGPFTSGRLNALGMLGTALGVLFDCTLLVGVAALVLAFNLGRAYLRARRDGALPTQTGGPRP